MPSEKITIIAILAITALAMYALYLEKMDIAALLGIVGLVAVMGGYHAGKITGTQIAQEQIEAVKEVKEEITR